MLADDVAQQFSFPRGFWGDPDLLEDLSEFFNTYFQPHVPVKASHIVTAPGAGGCIDVLMYNVCNQGDGILVPVPYWGILRHRLADSTFQTLTQP